MKLRVLGYWLIFFCVVLFDGKLSFALGQTSSLEISPQWAKSVGTCQVTGTPKKQVYFFKQWHLAPGVDTTQDPEEALHRYPQFENQRAIYEQIDLWIADQAVSFLIAEGCPAPREIDSSSPEKFNGWSVEKLALQANSPQFKDLLTNVGYKLEAKWRKKLSARCGDDPGAIKKNLVAFSDARGNLGFLSRLKQYEKDPARAKTYLEGVIELDHLSASTKVSQAIERLKADLKKNVEDIQRWIEIRNEKLVAAIEAVPAARVVVVFGGAHAKGVQALLEKKGIGCTILEPVGYRDDETLMLGQLKSLIEKL